jgi:hypothetical protein
MPYRYTLNPALGADNDLGYFAIPALGNLNLDLHSSMGLRSFLQPSTDGETLIGFWDKDFDGPLPQPKLSFDFDMPLLSFGFFAFGGFNTFSIDLHNSLAFSLDEGIFELAKNGIESERDYKFNLDLRDQLYASVGFGHSRYINERLALGGTLKLLVGVANLSGSGNVGLNIGREALSLNAMVDGRIDGWRDLLSGGANGDSLTLNTPSFGGLPGWGLGLDLGATYKLLDNLTLAFAVTDLGFVRWSASTHATIQNKVKLLRYNDLLNDFMNDVEASRTDSLTAIASDISSTGASTSWLSATVSAGAEYGIAPLHNKISIGLLSTTRISRVATWTELMASLNLKPARWFHLSLTGSLYSFGSTPDFAWGAVVSWAPRYFMNIFVGVESMPISKYGTYNGVPVPLGNLSTHVNLGFNIPLNRNKYKADRKPLTMPADSTANIATSSVVSDSLRVTDSLRVADSLAAAAIDTVTIVPKKLTREELLRKAMEDENSAGDKPKPKTKKLTKAELLRKAMEDENQAGDKPKAKPKKPTKAELLRQAKEDEERAGDKPKKKK